MDAINERILDCIPGNSTVSHSVQDCNDKQRYVVEFLNTLMPSGMPPHDLKLKEGVPLILLRNVDMTRGLCNGTRLILRRVSTWTLDAEIAVGHYAGARVLIPRTTITSAPDEYPFVLERRQFPVRLAFAMTINKSQGQTVRGSLGLYLPMHTFSHGQLYVAASRVDTASCFKVAITATVNNPGDDHSHTRNVVYREVLE